MSNVYKENSLGEEYDDAVSFFSSESDTSSVRIHRGCEDGHNCASDSGSSIDNDDEEDDSEGSRSTTSGGEEEVEEEGGVDSEKIDSSQDKENRRVKHVFASRSSLRRGRYTNIYNKNSNVRDDRHLRHVKGCRTPSRVSPQYTQLAKLELFQPPRAHLCDTWTLKGNNRGDMVSSKGEQKINAASACFADCAGVLPQSVRRLFVTEFA